MQSLFWFKIFLMYIIRKVYHRNSIVRITILFLLNTSWMMCMRPRDKKILEPTPVFYTLLNRQGQDSLGRYPLRLGFGLNSLGINYAGFRLGQDIEQNKILLKVYVSQMQSVKKWGWLVHNISQDIFQDRDEIKKKKNLVHPTVHTPIIKADIIISYIAISCQLFTSYDRSYLLRYFSSFDIIFLYVYSCKNKEKLYQNLKNISTNMMNSGFEGNVSPDESQQFLIV